MDKRYQVFVSSTFEDLKGERQEVIQALLELDCMPAGMELFPAADDDQWTLIKKVIDDCDYYIVVIAGRYGSLGPTGLSYTQMEYEYAVEKRKPVITFLHKEPGRLPADRVELTPEGRQKLEAFCALARKRMCKYWDSPASLGSVVSRRLVQLIKNKPAVGWVRADLVPDANAAAEMLRLRKQIDELQERLAALTEQGPGGTEVFAQGDDKVSLNFSVGCFRSSQFTPDKRMTSVVATTWNAVFAQLAPLMINEASESRLRKEMSLMIEGAAGEALKHTEAAKDYRLANFALREDDFQTIKVQLRALGLVAKSTKPRSLKDTETYWTLTPHGDRVMTQLRAVRREAVKPKD